MPVTQEVAQTTAREMLAGLGKFFHKAAADLHDLFTGRWVTSSSINLKTGVSTKVFRNGATVISRPGMAHEIKVPQSWLDGSDGLLKQLRQGTWVTKETWHAGSPVVEKTFKNGIKVNVLPAQQVLAGAKLPSTIIR